MPAVPLPPPPACGPEATLEWVAAHLDGSWSGPLTASPRFCGGAAAANAALAGLDVTGYAARRNAVWPADRRGASALSPWIRHGLLSLPTVWEASADGPARDVGKYHDELLWQEYSRHLYARLGPLLAHPLRARRNTDTDTDTDTDTGTGWDTDSDGGALARAATEQDYDLAPWPTDMACMDLTVGELHRDGWLVNQTRMWMASQWSVRHGRDWREGEDHFYRHLLDGSRAANRTGWQWTIGTGTGRPYGFSRWQVTKRAPGLCATCALNHNCPIASWPADDSLGRVEPDPRLRFDPDPERTAGPDGVDRFDGGTPEAVWLTAESLGDDDPALDAHPELPAVFVFDTPLLARLQLTAKRLVFLAEAIGDLGERRPVEVLVGDPADLLAGRRLAATFTPVPGWHRRRRRLDVVEVHPWPWLRRPHSGPISSFSAWRSHKRR